MRPTQLLLLQRRMRRRHLQYSLCAPAPHASSVEISLHFEAFFSTATQTQPYAWQRAFAAVEKLPDTIEAPTGSGKTAGAVLGWLWRRLHGNNEQRAEAGARLVFCLPMRTLVTQTHRNVLRWRERLSLNDSLGVHVLMGGAVDDTWEEHPDQDAIVIGTQDQLLSRALFRGYGMSRFRWPVHFALLNNDCTWLLDEVQLMGVGASTAAQLQGFRERLKTVGSVKTVWMTATLNEGRLKTVDFSRPLHRLPFDAAGDAGLLQRTRAAKQLLPAESTAKDTKALAAEVVKYHVADTLTLVIVNRVQRAQELFRLLEREKATLGDLALIHSRFRPSDRGPMQDEVLSGTFKGVVVATQAIEAGVDLSARTLFTELAPWSSLVQRFGRLNRAGEWQNNDATARWIDLDTSKDDDCKPYDGVALAAARERLLTLRDVGPATLAALPRDVEEPALPVVRRKDLLELFDTEPDLSGHDIDISRYVRATDDDRDLQVAWRQLGDDGPGENAADLARDELCRVPCYELTKLAKGEAVWRFDSLRKEWVTINADKLFPGLVVVVDVSIGGYSDRLGFTKEKSDVPTASEGKGAPPDDDSSDTLAKGAEYYVTLAQHSDEAVQEMLQLLGRLGRVIEPIVDPSALVAMARWHDLGKSHDVFQTMLTKKLNEEDPIRLGGPWAKSDRQGSGRSARKFFRHELASALAWLQAGHSDLGTYVIAAHHGKVRMSLRARPGEAEPPKNTRFANGIWDGDALPAAELGGGISTMTTVLSLACMELGGGGAGRSWSDRMQRLLAEHGPFRLAFLETLLRVADWRASARHNAVPNVTGAVNG
jgi:CRISPR-associated endonuclease/helicase Cas3